MKPQKPACHHCTSPISSCSAHISSPDPRAEWPSTSRNGKEKGQSRGRARERPSLPAGLNSTSSCKAQKEHALRMGRKQLLLLLTHSIFQAKHQLSCGEDQSPVFQHFQYCPLPFNNNITTLLLPCTAFPLD